MPRKPKSIAVRFWAKVRKGIKCWEWQGALVCGYGQLHGGVGKPRYRAHRLSWALHFGPIPDGLHVLHKCDNTRCVRPDHLFLGTPLDNARDRESKNRGNPVAAGIGEHNPNAKLTGADVLAIRVRLQAGESGRAIADAYQITPTTVSNIKTGKRWGSLTEA